MKWEGNDEEGSWCGEEWEEKDQEDLGLHITPRPPGEGRGEGIESPGLNPC
jgi:hypothetical protein